MMKTRVIPSLLLLDGGLVKTEKFRAPKYVGDPINAIRIFNEKEVDELLLLDIGATTSGKGPDMSTIEDMVGEAFMPVAYGGGVSKVEHARALFSIGIEKVVLNTAAGRTPELINKLADTFGSQSVVVSIDVAKKGFYRAIGRCLRMDEQIPVPIRHLWRRMLRAAVQGRSSSTQSIETDHKQVTIWKPSIWSQELSTSP